MRQKSWRKKFWRARDWREGFVSEAFAFCVVILVLLLWWNKCRVKDFGLMVVSCKVFRRYDTYLV